MRPPLAPLVLIAALVLAAPTPVAAEETVRYYQIPVIVNVHTESGVQVANVVEVYEAIEEANKILAKALIRLEMWGFNVGDADPMSNPSNPANAGNGDGDASMDIDERTAARAAGDKELDDDPDIGDDRGMKIYYTSVVDETDDDEAGTSVHKRRTIIVRKVPDADPKKSIRKTGETIAHEACHALTLGKGHQVTTSGFADGAGHVSDSVSPNNLMSGAGFGNTDLTDVQILEIQTKADEWGSVEETESQFFFPVEEAPQQSGGGGDDADDHAGGDVYFDIAGAGLHSRTDDTTLELRLTTNGAIPDDVPLDVHYRWLFDTDDDPGTGLVVSGVPGVDRQVDIHVLGSGIGPPTVDAELLDDFGLPMMPVAVDAGPEEEFEILPAVAVNHAFDIDLDKGLLGLAAPAIPVAVVSEGGGFFPADSFSFTFDTSSNPFRRIDFDLATPVAGLGDTVDWSVLSSIPLADGTIKLDSTPVASGLVVSAGVPLGGSFAMCDLPWDPDIDYFFVTMIDGMVGPADFSIVHVERPEDGFESYVNGSDLHGQGRWKGWNDDPTAGAVASQDQAHDGVQSVKVEGTSDLVQELCTPGDGAWAFSGWQYIPTSFASGGGGAQAGSWFILLNTYDDGGPHDWSVQLQFDSNDGLLKVQDEGFVIGGQTPYATDRWVRIQTIIDLDDDWTRIYYDDALVAEYEWTGGVLGTDTGALDIGAVDLFANGASPLYYDELRLERIGGCGDALADDLDADGLDRLAEFLGGSDSCDPDSDDDGFLDGADNCPLDDNPLQEDIDGDGIGDLCDPVPSCPGDLAAPLDGVVDVTDLLQVLAAWGTPGGDADGDGDTDVNDLLLVLGAWGTCP